MGAWLTALCLVALAGCHGARRGGGLSLDSGTTPRDSGGGDASVPRDSGPAGFDASAFDGGPLPPFDSGPSPFDSGPSTRDSGSDAGPRDAGRRDAGSSGTCSPACTPASMTSLGTICCGGTCVPESDTNCGACGNACAPGSTTCVYGTSSSGGTFHVCCGVSFGTGFAFCLDDPDAGGP